MLKTMVIPDPILGETPFLKEVRLSRKEGIQIGREEGVQKGIQIGREEGVQEGLQKGVQIGREEGMQEGVQKGVREGLLDGIVFVLDMKYGKDGLLLLPEIRQMKNPDRLKSLYEVLRMAKNVEDVQQEIHRLNAIDEAMNGVAH